MKYIDLIEKSADRASDLTNKLLLFSRKKKIEKTTFDIRNLLNDTIEILRSTIDKKIRISMENDNTDSIIYGDQSAIQSVFMNLGINASHAMTDGGQILIKTQNVHLDKDYCDDSNFNIEPGDFVELEVSDTGSGIPPEHLDKIFDPFFTTKEQGKGTGLGLSVTYGTIQDNHGAVTVESQIDVGTKFYLFLPLSKESVLKEQKLRVSNPGIGTILFVDDEEINRITGQDILESLGYTVLVTKTGKECIEVYQDKMNYIDVIISDMIMPEMNGAELFAKLREINPICKFVLVSGYSKDNQLKNFNPTGFIQKPYSIPDISQILNDVINKDI